HSPTPPVIYAPPLHDALPIWRSAARLGPGVDDQVLSTALEADPVAHHWVVNLLTRGGVHDRSLLPARPRGRRRIQPYSGHCGGLDRKSTRLNSSHEWISYAVF